MLRSTVLGFLASGLFLSLCGCGGGGAKSGGPTAPSNMDTVADVAEMLKEYCAANKRPPNSLADLEDASATHPVGHAAASTKEFVIYYKVMINSAKADTVLAYHKDVPASGGVVVMQDGSVKEMTAADFASAPKAGK